MLSISPGRFHKVQKIQILARESTSNQLIFALKINSVVSKTRYFSFHREKFSSLLRGTDFLSQASLGSVQP